MLTKQTANYKNNKPTASDCLYIYKIVTKRGSILDVSPVERTKSESLRRKCENERVKKKRWKKYKTEQRR
jgi:hypothetical protein